MSSTSNETRADRADRLRDAVDGLVKRSSWRQAAEVIGVSVGAIRNLLKGSTPQETTMEAFERWAVSAGVLQPMSGQATGRPVWKSDEEIGETIRAIRKRCGYTQQRLAEEIGMPGGQADISRWESGKGGRPGYDVLEAIARLEGRDARIFQETEYPPEQFVAHRVRESFVGDVYRPRRDELDLTEAERWLAAVVDPELRIRWAGTPDFIDNMLAASDIVSRRQWPTERKLAVQALIHRLIQDETQGRN